MNDLQKAVFAILECFLKVCEDLNLKYYLVNGSALGAVKYGGFIPWDDDIDVAMPRSDYEAFCEKAQELLPTHIFLQNYKTDKNFPFLYTKLRNSNTTFIEEGVSNLEINHGLYVDVFPLDGFPEDIRIQKKMLIKLKFLQWQQFCAIKSDTEWKVFLRNAAFRFLGYHRRTNRVLSKMDRLVNQYKKDTLLWCNYGDRQRKGGIPRDYYGVGKVVAFEGMTVTVPEKIDEYLTHKYGDWRQDIAESNKKTHHETVICDLNTPYTEYWNKSL